MRELQPLNDKVLLQIEKEEGERKTASGIIIPSTATAEKNNIAKVIAIGKIEDCAIVVGDQVIYKQYSGKDIEFEGEKYLFVAYEDLLAKIVETERI